MDMVSILEGFLQAMIRTACPVMLASLGALFTARAGIINFAMEGIMITGAFFGVYGSYMTNNPWVGALLAMAGGLVACEQTQNSGPDQAVEELENTITYDGQTVSFTLPEGERALFVRRYWHSESIAALAERFGLSQGRVTRVLFRLRRGLRAHLEGKEIFI